MGPFYIHFDKLRFYLVVILYMGQKRFGSIELDQLSEHQCEASIISYGFLA